MTRRFLVLSLCIVVAALTAASVDLLAQPGRAILKVSENKPLASLSAAGAAALATPKPFRPGVREIPNFRGEPAGPAGEGPDPILQNAPGPLATSVLAGFEGSDNEDNLATVGFRVAPPDTDGDVGPNHYLQMINLITTIFDKSGNIVMGGGPFPSNAFWSGMGGNCEPFNQGDPVALYDETNDRWLVSQFAFDDNFTTFSQCVAVSQSGDPTAGYNRYEFSFDGLGLPDYPKHGIVSDSITMTANLFSPPLFFFSGTFIGAMDKDAMYAGLTTTLVGFNLGSGQFGFLPADLDDPAGVASFTPALFATAMSRRRRFDIWEIDVDWNNPGAASASRVDDVRISNFDSDLCGASREACIPQPGGAPSLEAISDRLMHRLQIRDFGTHKSMMAAHTVDADGNGTAGVRWYEMRQNPNNGNWTQHQSATYAPNDGLHRWMPSIAINAAGDIGLGFLVSSTSEPLGVRLTGQTAAASGSGSFDSAEEICRAGDAPQTGTARSGDYSATTVDPGTDNFWHTSEYGQNLPKAAAWGTFVCEFALSSSCVPTEPMEMSCNDGIDNDCDGLIDGDDPDCGGPMCIPDGDSCSKDSDCCSGNCSNGPPSTRVCQP